MVVLNFRAPPAYQAVLDQRIADQPYHDQFIPALFLALFYIEIHIRVIIGGFIPREKYTKRSWDEHYLQLCTSRTSKRSIEGINFEPPEAGVAHQKLGRGYQQ